MIIKPIEKEEEEAPMREAASVVTRDIAEIQSMMTIAKKFPRDVTVCYNRIMSACKRRGLAEQAKYAYPKGTGNVEGPSIRLAEALAQSWGNIDVGVTEVEQRDGESTMIAYAIDLETNTRFAKRFVVQHVRDSKRGRQELTDGRDIYELTANMGARRLRACILAIIPRDIIEAAEAECERTLQSKNPEPLIDRVRSMVLGFSSIGVSQEMIEKRLGHKIDATIEAELIGLRKIYASIRDQFSNRADWFEVAALAQTPQQIEGSSADALNNRAKTKTKALAPPVAEWEKDLAKEKPGILK